MFLSCSLNQKKVSGEAALLPDCVPAGQILWSQSLSPSLSAHFNENSSTNHNSIKLKQIPTETKQKKDGGNAGTTTCLIAISKSQQKNPFRCIDRSFTTFRPEASRAKVHRRNDRPQQANRIQTTANTSAGLPSINFG
jgi:hypothetical protein